MILWGLIAAAQDKPEPAAIPVDVATDVYAIYSAVLNPPKLSHKDDGQKYLVLNVTVAKPFSEPEKCIQPPAAYRAGFAEIVDDYLKHRNDSFRLERKFTMPKPYEFVTEAEASRFQKGRVVSQTGPNHDAPKFLGAVDLILLGNVYFNRARTLAAVSTEAWCGGLCAVWTWRIFEKQQDGRWKELSSSWSMCFTQASNYGPAGNDGLGASDRGSEESVSAASFGRGSFAAQNRDHRERQVGI